ncbi:MAG: hypothetical protein MUF69_04230 [Desulfobacterota bacterium]|nr:hypothetical protein [Thermodesulfobacteriota bacterium]
MKKTFFGELLPGKATKRVMKGLISMGKIPLMPMACGEGGFSRSGFSPVSGTSQKARTPTAEGSIYSSKNRESSSRHKARLLLKLRFTIFIIGK